MSEEIRRYTVVTNNGYWGKGATPAEAASNAQVRNKYVEGYICYADPLIVEGEIEITETGGVQWLLNQRALDLCQEWNHLGDVFRKRIIVFKGKLKVASKKLEVRGEIITDGYQV